MEFVADENKALRHLNLFIYGDTYSTFPQEFIILLFYQVIHWPPHMLHVSHEHNVMLTQ